MDTADGPRYRVSDGIAWIDGTEFGMGEQLYLTRLPRGDTVLLEGTARMIFHSAIGDRALETSLVNWGGQPWQVIQTEVGSFLRRLCDRGYLSPNRSTDEPAGPLE